MTSFNFSFSLDDRSVTMTPSDGQPIAEAPACAVCVLQNGTRHYMCSGPTADGRGPGPLREVNLAHFLKVMYRDGTPRPPWWLMNPFTYKNRVRRYVASTCNPTLFVLDDEYEERFAKLVALSSGSVSRRAFFDWTQFYVYGYQSRKGYGGGHAVLNTSDLQVIAGSPSAPNLSSECLGLVCDSLEVWFTPGIVIVSPPGSTNSSSVVASAYDDISVEFRETNLITSFTLPGDQVVGTTWTYVNKDGSRDRRYNDNPQLAVVRMWEVDLIGRNFRVDLQFADSNFAQKLASGINAMKLASS